MYVGDVRLGDTFDVKFCTVQSSGAPTTLAGSPAVAAYPGNSTTEITAGITLSVDFDSRTGLHNVRVVATGGNGYATATNYALVMTAGTVNSVSVVGYVIGHFSIENRSALMPTTAARTLDVSAGGEAGVDWANVGSPTTSLNLSGTTVATASAIGTGGIAAASFAAGAIDAAAIAANAIGASEIADGAIDAGALAADCITAAKIADGAIDAATFAAGAIDATAIAANAIGASELAADAIAEIADGVWDEDDTGHTTTNTYGNKLGAHVEAVLKLVVGLGSTTTAVVFSTVDGAAPSATDDFYNGRVIVFTSGALKGQATSISDYTGATTTATVPALTGAPAQNVTAVIV